MSNIRLSCVMIALAKLDQIFAYIDLGTHYERARALYDASTNQISEDNTYLDWVNHVRSGLPFCSLDLIEEQTVYRWYLDVVKIDNGLPF